MNKHNLIRCFFATPQDAVRFFVQLKEERVANNDATCIAVLEKTTDEMWTYTLEWKDGKFVGEHLHPFKPSLENIEKFNRGCDGLADILESCIESDVMSLDPDAVSPFGDLAYSSKKPSI